MFDLRQNSKRLLYNAEGVYIFLLMVLSLTVSFQGWENHHGHLASWRQVYHLPLKELIDPA